jgi:hypothetical protein
MEKLKVADIEPLVINRPNLQPVNQYGLDGKFIASFDSIKECSEATGCNKQSISNCLNGKAKQSKGFQFRKA